MRKNSGLRVILIVFGSSIALTRLLASLFLIWLTLGWKVRKARKTFEKQLIKKGMDRQDAKRISAQYAALRDNIENAFKQSLRRWR